MPRAWPRHALRYGRAGRLTQDPTPQVAISNSRRTSLSEVLRSVDALREPTMSAHGKSYVPAGYAFGRVPGSTTARGGTYPRCSTGSEPVTSITGIEAERTTFGATTAPSPTRTPS